MSDLVVSEVAAETVVYDQSGGRLHRLNRGTAAVLKACTGRRTVAEIASDLSSLESSGDASIEQQVKTALELLASNGLVVSGERPKVLSADPRPSTWVVPASFGTSPPTATTSIGPLRALGAEVIIDCHVDGAMVSELQRVFRSLVTTAGRRTGSQLRFVLWDGPDGWALRTGEATICTDDPSKMIDFVVGEVNYAAIKSSNQYLILHAAAVAADGRAIVMPAVANGGKSTLAMVLAGAGYTYLGDELAAIDLQTGEVVAYPKAISLDPGSQALLAHLTPERRVAGNSPKWHVDPGRRSTAPPETRVPLAHIVFPSYDADGDNTLHPIDPLDALMALAPHAINLQRHARRLDRIIELLTACSTDTIAQNGIDALVDVWQTEFPLEAN